ncbi:signal peptidase [Rhodonellum psychrophilum GCM71 = DSM 17998]|uniref:Lipoprotein signal peptidase n=2 Tax=Rhodonellum TaxID=336827 RepID=U5C115_9BACT|nr:MULTISPECIES: lipoprotein signal peptidase [Rhodonellum]ERM83768.1 signal peptidase [Rhodonellum psychrophilum GCM71 = DSM 17998]MDO9551674.1 lipoprotein signal peptidase [Rhodonellum sp.]SDY64740.1 signal peptidase II Aspartic peptidase. MEROPS family A08 [Rhodonellum ikkaensis]
MRYLKYFGISLLIIIIDQAVKMLVHYEMDFGTPGQIKVFGDWFKLHYTTNPGMAFGMQLGSEYGKMILTSFRLIAMFGIGYYLYYLIKKRVHSGYIFCISMILGGAIGNLIDSVFYGVWLNNAPYNAPTPWFHGQVIDMFYIDIWEGFIPEWIPIWGGSYTALWPIFNIADASIFVGVAIILIFQGRFFKEENENSDKKSLEEDEIQRQFIEDKN